jgi:Exonuclease
MILPSWSPPLWMSRPPARIPIATRSSNSASASSNMTVRTGGSTKFSAPRSGSKIPAFDPAEITKITGITDATVAGHRIDDGAINDLLGRVVLVIAHHADFDRRFLERRLPVFATKHWACSRFDIDWKAEGIRSSAIEFVAYSLGFFHDGHRAASDCRATLHALAQPLPGTGRLAL